MPSLPRLLVSVRNGEEALIAARNEVDLIDFKEPQRGALGMVAGPVLQSSVASLHREKPSQVISLACGEVLDAPEEDVKIFLPGVKYLKLGLSGLRGRKNWQQVWLERREQLAAAPCDTQSISLQDGHGPLPPLPVGNREKNGLSFDGERGEFPAWIAVAYVDDRQADAPPIEEVIQGAIETNCAGVLFDTFTKDWGGLFEFLPPARLARLTHEIQQANLLVAAAGRLTAMDLPQVCSAGVDIVAIRSAACRKQDRQGTLCPEALQVFRAALRMPR